MDCLCCVRARYESFGCEEDGDVLEGADVASRVSKGVSGLRTSFSDFDGESVCVSGLDVGDADIAGAELSGGETVFAISCEVSSGFAMRRPPREPDRSRSPFMMRSLHSKWKQARFA